MAFFRFLPLCIGLVGLSDLFAAGYGFDVGTAAAEHASDLARAGLDGSHGTWMRVRGIHEPAEEQPGDVRTVATERAGLQALRDRGIRLAVHTRWSPTVWSQGVRTGGGHRLPLDLSEVYERCRRLGAAYGDLVDVWEIENEPDIDFVAENPETYAAFQKAVYLGFKAAKPLSRSSIQPSTSNVQSDELAGSDWLNNKRGLNSSSGFKSQSSGLPPTTPRVVMAPLALPPGPYLERLWANGLGSYTDGFNFHYYGYAEDFTGVYRQFESAVGRWKPESENLKPEAGGLLSGTQELKNSSGAVPSAQKREARRLETRQLVARKFPVFITEYGYGLLDADARDTVEGRVRQWRWFANVAKQIRTLRPEGPMAFLFNPYYEADLNEFGLTTSLPATSITFSPSDFGEKRVQPWMQRIGKKVGEAHASPALAYLWDYAERHPYRARHWTVRAEPPSPVVVDFIADEDMVQMKSSGGYVVTGKATRSEQRVTSMIETADASTTRYSLGGTGGASSATRAGRGRAVVYNFSTAAIAGRLVVERGDGRTTEEAVTLAPGERWERLVVLRVQAESYVAQACRMTFVPDAEDISAAVWETRLLPSRDGLASLPVESFDFTEASSQVNRTKLQARARAVGEPELKTAGRWLVSDGVRVEERGGVWRLHIDALPAEPLRPAVAELPLPNAFKFPAGTLLLLDRRKVATDEPTESGLLAARHSLPVISPQRLKSRAGQAGGMMDVYVRTENGNLFQTWPRLRVKDEWLGYTGAADDFTMAFFGRAALPWRFTENRPAALVFFLRPSQLPATFEVRNARIVRLAR